LIGLLFFSAFAVWPAFIIATWGSIEQRLTRWVLGVLFVIQLLPLADAKLSHEPDPGRRDDAMIGVTAIVAVSFCISLLVLVAGQAPRWFGVRGRGPHAGA
jgi:phosphatidylserine synthase